MSNNEQLQRVSTKLRDMVREFLTHRLEHDPVFHMQDLYEYVSKITKVSPTSPGRIMQLLKREGEVDYVVEDRYQSRYRALRAGEFRFADAHSESV